jgi:hypothetical protein
MDDQDTGSPGRPVSSGLQVPGEADLGFLPTGCISWFSQSL